MKGDINNRLVTKETKRSVYYRGSGRGPAFFKVGAVTNLFLILYIYIQLKTEIPFSKRPLKCGDALVFV